MGKLLILIVVLVLIDEHRDWVRSKIATISTSASLNASFSQLNASIPTSPHPNFAQFNAGNDPTRSIPYILLKTFALRMGVFTAYGHLLTLQGLSSKTSTAVPRNGGSHLFTCRYYRQPLLIELHPGCRLFRSWIAWPWRWSMVSAAVLHISIRPKDAADHEIVKSRDILVKMTTSMLK